MDLQEFIKNTLISIRNGVRGANSELAKKEKKELGKNFNPVFGIWNSGEKGQDYISFDIAVTVSKESEKSAGGGIKIAVLDVGGKVGGSNLQESVSRIKFSVKTRTDIV